MNKIKRKIKELFIYFLRKIKIKSIYSILSVTHAQFYKCQDFWLPVMDYPRASRSSTRGSQARGTRLEPNNEIVQKIVLTKEISPELKQVIKPDQFA